MHDAETSHRVATQIGLPESFSEYHGRLFDLCLIETGAIRSTTNHSLQARDLEQGGEILTRNDLKALSTMAELEFLASMNQELNGTETSENAEPHVFDVFLMTRTMLNNVVAEGRVPTARPIAVCAPFRKRLMWWDGFSLERGGAMWPLQPQSHVRKIASLSGSARVLQALALAYHLASEGGLVDAVMNRDHMFRVDSFENPAPLHIGTSLNEAQERAVQAVSSFNSGFFCIHGPPGCGKTTTMVEMILAAKARSSVLVVAPSNAAVANVALKLYHTGLVPFGRMVVFGENCHDSVRFLQPKFRGLQYMQFCDDRRKALYVPEGKEVSFRQEAAAKKILLDMVNWLHLPEKDAEEWTSSDIAKLCPILSLEDDGSLSRKAQSIIRDLMIEADIVFCTLNSAGSYSLRSALTEARFDTLMLDEGGQCTEAEFFITATFPGIRRIVVMGDPNQLQPTVISPDCAIKGFGNSFLGQVYKKDKHNLHLLDTQYRMDPIILRFPNRQFYGGRIKNGENVQSREPMVEHPFLFEDTARNGQESKIGFSWQNQYEVSVINIMLRRDSDIQMLLQAGIDGETKVIIITPYKSQMTLLHERIQLPKGSKACIKINTVDAFQGQEGDIVIVSTVRTKSPGFVDNAQRLNVALTRAKRVLRIVGEYSFFQQLGRSSTLRALAHHASKHDLVIKSKISRLRHCPPDWTIPTLWSITLTQRFHHCIREMKSETEKKYCLNTLHALATPNLSCLKGGKVSETPGWKMNSLNDATGQNLCIVWIAKTSNGKSTVEAHFAGQRKAALHFQQLHCHGIPQGSRAPKRDMCGLLGNEENIIEGNTSFVPSWRLDNSMQDLILSDAGQEMPFCILELDPAQKLVAHSRAPLMIESRSGTGKTLVLLQHVALTIRQDPHRLACFVTVSPRLKEELQKKYDELRSVLFAGLPPTAFFTFRSLLDELVGVFGIHEFEGRDICTLGGYYAVKRSHNQHAIDPQLVQNEIGGVIMGSLDAAILRRPLNLGEYLDNKRSNIPNRTSEGKGQRISVYEEYRRYREWKLGNNAYDLADVVLRLLDRDLPQYFSNAYLDEVQDLSHAAIYLICHLAGRDNLQWICAGDPAQMISPGCSFTFDGLKQTLLSIAPGIESKLREVHHLVVNYRTTKEILVMANAILDTAKRSFPGSIEYALPERAVKDLGLRVVTCNWEHAMQTTVKFGGNQVLIYSPSDSITIPEAAKEWLNEHPFILSSLDSKGLEFDDVVVAFQFDRKYWDLSRKQDTSLRMLRELYVAVTRAQRRVVVLVEPRNDKMNDFFRRLNCEELPAHVILQEFNHKTTKEEWHRRGLEFFYSERFEIAASCFARSDQPGWAFWATGKAKFSLGLNTKADESFKQATGAFFERQCFAQVLDIMKELLSINREWDHSLDDFFSSSIAHMPRYLSKNHVIQFHLKRDHWHIIRHLDLCESSLSHVFYGYRRHKKFKAIVENASEEERKEIGSILPWAHADYHIDRGNHVEAIKISLSSSDFLLAGNCSDQLLDDRTWRTCVDNCKILVRLWKPHATKARTSCSTELLPLLQQIISSPQQTAAKSGPDCLRIFGRDVVRDAFMTAKLDMVELLVFRDKDFNAEVLSMLERRHEANLTKVVEVLVDAGYTGLAGDFARRCQWSNDDCMRLTIVLRECPTWLLRELDNRHLLRAVTQMIQCSGKFSVEKKLKYKANVERSFPGISLDKLDRLTLMDVCSAEGSSKDLRQRGMYVELSFIYAHLGFFHIAAKQSVNALKSIGPSSLHQIRMMWEEVLPPKAKNKMPSLQRLLINLLAACREKVNYSEERKVEKIPKPKVDDSVGQEAGKVLSEEAGKVLSEEAGKVLSETEIEKITITCTNEEVAFSLEWLFRDSPINMFHLIKEFGPAIAAYTQLLSIGLHNDESLLRDLMSHHEALKERLEQQLGRLEGKQEKRRRLGAQNGTKIIAFPSTPSNAAVSNRNISKQPTTDIS